jgi:hypothetical protein
MSTTHHLKTHPGPFADVLAGLKQFEIRKNDRAFAVGDVLVLEEWDPAEYEREFYLQTRHIKGSPREMPEAWDAGDDRAIQNAYTGRTCTRTVSYIFNPGPDGGYGLEPGYVVLSLSAGGASS